MQYAGFKAHTHTHTHARTHAHTHTHRVKHGPLPLHLLEQTIKFGLQFCFTCFGGCKSVNNRLTIKNVAFNSHERQGTETFIRHSCTNFVLYLRQHLKRHLTAAVSTQHTETEICTWLSAPLSRPGP